jgi:hypothetical protein
MTHDGNQTTMNHLTQNDDANNDDEFIRITTRRFVRHSLMPWCMAFCRFCTPGRTNFISYAKYAAGFTRISLARSSFTFRTHTRAVVVLVVTCEIYTTVETLQCEKGLQIYIHHACTHSGNYSVVAKSPFK